MIGRISKRNWFNIQTFKPINMRTHIIIHILPYEIDRFEQQCFELRKNAAYLSDDDKVVIDATLNVNDLLVDWNKSKINKQYFIDRFDTLKLVCDWAEEVIFDVSENNECLGVNDKRRTAIRKYSTSCDNFLYLDNDVFYPNTALKYMIDATKTIKNKYYILSPQLPKLWEPSWNVLVNQVYINTSFEDSTCKQYTTDQFEVFTSDYGDIELVPIDIFKMGGGWFNLISSNLLKFTDLPNSLGPYGLDDDWVIDICKLMKSNGYDIQQYVLKNLVVTQSYQYELHRIYLNYLSFDIKQKQIFAENARRFYQSEINNFVIKNNLKLF
jgi:hypothetical protein